MPIPKGKKKGNQPKVFIGIFNDAGGFIISVDVWGRPHIKPVPPWQPDIERLATAANLLAQAGKVKNRETRKQLEATAQRIAGEAMPVLRERIAA
jgi:hypothetical protein